MTAERVTYMIDTSFLNRLADGEISLDIFSGGRLLVTGIQRDELAATKEPERKAKLLAYADVLPSETVLAESFALGIEGAGFDQAYLNDGSGDFDAMLARLRCLDWNNPIKKRRKRSKKLGDDVDRNQNRDILIAETAIKDEAILATSDVNLRTVVEEFGGRVLFVP